jgi:hypothetical protein
LDLLIDSCSYFRIARNLHPLLGQPQGPTQYKLFIHLFFYDEFSKNSQLSTQFQWVNEPEFDDNRKNFCVNILEDRVKEIMRVYTTINSYKRQSKSNISEVDLYALSIAHVLNITLITDDCEMRTAAIEFEIDCMKTMDYLNYLYCDGIIDDPKLLEIFDYWIYDNDCPSDYNSDLSKYFSHLNNK